MKGTLTVLCAGLAFSWVAVAGAAGQSGYGQSGSSQSESPKHSSKDSREVTLSGCLEQGSSPTTFVLRNATQEEGQGSSMSGSSSSQGTSGSSAQSGSSSQGTSGSSQGEQTGASGQSSMQSEKSGMDFQLVGHSKELKKYVGQRIQVRGIVEPMEQGGQSGMSSQSGSGTGEASGMSGSEGGSQSGSQGTSGSSMGGQSGSTSGQSSSAGAVTHRVKVSSVKQLGSSCQ